MSISPPVGALSTYLNRVRLSPPLQFLSDSVQESVKNIPIIGKDIPEELKNISGVGDGKALKFGSSFVKLIENYVSVNQIERPDDLVVKTTGSNSSLKLFIIQSIDRKLQPIDIADSRGIDLSELITELQTIVFSGTRLNIDYMIDEIFDEDQQEELHEYFMSSESEDISDALKEFNGEYDEEELRIFRVKFLSDVS